MKTWVRKTLSVGVLTAGALLLAPTAAQAADIQQASSNDGDTDGILNNAQIAAPIDIPVNLCSIAVGVLGDGYAASECSNDLPEHSITQGGGGGDVDGIANNLQAAVPISVPVNVIGVAAGILGDASAEGVGKNGGHATESSQVEEHGKAQGKNWGSADVDGIGNNLQVFAPIHVPVNAGGIAIGDAKSAAKLSNGGWAKGHGAGEGTAITQGVGGGDTDGVLNNAQVAVPVNVPINLCGVAVGLLGDGEAAADCNNASGGGWGEHGITQGVGGGDTDGILNNLQVAVPVDVPINICGVAAGVLGDGEAAAQCSNGGPGDDTGVSPEGPDSHYPSDDEEPTDESPVDEEPMDEEPVDDNSGDPSGDYDGVSPDAYGDGADAGRHASRESFSLPVVSELNKGGASNNALGGLPVQGLLSGLLGG
jgi:hypothetical protein